jgi:Family of unknown function (DUF6788)
MPLPAATAATNCCRHARSAAAPAAVDRTGAPSITDAAQPHGPYYQWTAKLNGKTVTRRLTDREAELYKAWIANDRQLRAVIGQMRQVAAKAGELIIAEVDDT